MKKPQARPQPVDLRYVNDLTVGICRSKVGKHFRYLGTNGHPVRDAETLARIKHLAIYPPGPTFWICPEANGHIQAVGRDARGRKQYRYHVQWQAERNRIKFDRMIPFGEALPTLRERISHDLGLPGLPREKVLALLVDLLDMTGIRVGNLEYTRDNHSFGLTTLWDRHVQFSGQEIRFAFMGKSNKFHTISLHAQSAGGYHQALQGHPRSGSVPVHRSRGQPSGRDLDGRERLSARGDGPGLHSQKFSDVERQQPGGAGPDRKRPGAISSGSQKEPDRHDQDCVRRSRQHADHLLKILSSPGDHRGIRS